MTRRVSPLRLALTLLALTVALVFFLFPVYWMVATSLKSQVDAFAMPPKWFPPPTLENYRQVLFETDFLR